MGQLGSYSGFPEKLQKFAQSQPFFKIDTVDQFDDWYKLITTSDEYKAKASVPGEIDTRNMFRGMGEAKHKMFTSAQRFWILNELAQWWAPKRYLEFVQSFVNNAKGKLLFNKVFEYYRLSHNQRDFPILSILQHYGAPTPLMDWTYNVDVALYFQPNTQLAVIPLMKLISTFLFIILIRAAKKKKNLKI